MATEDPSPDACPAFMLLHQEEGTVDKPDFQAASKTVSESKAALIRRHLGVLNQFSEADIQAAMQDSMEVEGTSPQADGESDDTLSASDGESSEGDNVPLN